MTNVGQLERITQNRVVQFFLTELGYSYLGNWQDRDNNRNIEPGLVKNWLKHGRVSSIDYKIHQIEQDKIQQLLTGKIRLIKPFKRVTHE